MVRIHLSWVIVFCSQLTRLTVAAHANLLPQGFKAMVRVQNARKSRVCNELDEAFRSRAPDDRPSQIRLNALIRFVICHLDREHSSRPPCVQSVFPWNDDGEGATGRQWMQAIGSVLHPACPDD